MCDYSTQTNCWNHKDGFWHVRQYSIGFLALLSTFCIILTIFLLEWGWKPQDKLTVAPRCLQNSFQNIRVS